MGIRITDKLVNELTPPASGNRITYDDPDAGPRQDKGVSGFGIRITANGVRTFILNYRVLGRERRMTIGRHGTWSVEAARKRARELRREVDGDNDPLAVRVEGRQAPSVGDLCDRYIEDHLPRKRTLSAADDKAMIASFIRPKFGAEKVATLTHSSVDQLHRSMKDKPYRANRVLSLLSKMFNLAIKWGWRTDNPAKGVDRYQEEKRERFLTGPEIAGLTKALASHADKDVANIVRLLLLTGARRGEVLQAEWSQFDLDAAKWEKPAATTKQKKIHRVPLSDGAVALLKAIYKAAPRNPDKSLKSSLVFPGPRSGAARTEIKDEWRAIAIKAGLYDEKPPATPKGKPVKEVNCRLHDLRHTYASLLVSAGLSLPIIGALLGHTQASTTHRYAHLMDDPLRAATNTVSAVVTGKQSAEVVPIEGAAA